MLTTRTGRWAAVAGLACVLLVIASWFLLVGPRRAQAAELLDQRVQAQAHNRDLQTRIEQLKAQFAELPAKQAELAAIQREMPADVDMPRLVRDLNRLAAAAGVTVTAVTPGEAEFVAAEAVPAEQGQQSPGSPESSKGTVTAQDSPVPAESGPATAQARLIAIPVAITVEGDYFQAALFLKYIQAKLDRALLVSSIEAAAVEEGASEPGSAEDGIVELTMNGRVFLLPTTADQAAAAMAESADAAGQSGDTTPTTAATEPPSA